MKKYIYPKLPALFDLKFIRVGGSGLANCMFVAARAFIRARQEQLELIEPAWLNFSLGPYLRHQMDKRHYYGIFRPYNRNYGLRKLFLLLFTHRQICLEVGLQKYFEDLLPHVAAVKGYFETILAPEILQQVNTFDFSNAIAVHIRLGDYPENRRTPIAWYQKKIQLFASAPQGKALRFLIFSDGTDEELAPVLTLPQTQKASFGNSIADIFAISRCRVLIGSDSTFSGWGAYLGQLPAVFFKKHYGRINVDASLELIDSSLDDDHALSLLARTREETKR